MCEVHSNEYGLSINWYKYGEREANLKLAVKLLTEAQGVRVEAVSSIYETAPVGFIEQAAFLNIAVRLTTDLPSAEMLHLCQK